MKRQRWGWNSNVVPRLSSSVDFYTNSWSQGQNITSQALKATRVLTRWGQWRTEAHESGRGLEWWLCGSELGNPGQEQQEEEEQEEDLLLCGLHHSDRTQTPNVNGQLLPQGLASGPAMADVFLLSVNPNHGQRLLPFLHPLNTAPSGHPKFWPLPSSQLLLK